MFVDHRLALIIPYQHGGLTFVRHNEIHYLTAEFLNKVCYDVAIEPPLQHLSRETIVPMIAN